MVYGISGLQQLMQDNIRVGTEIVNSNTLAIYLAISAVICFSVYLRTNKLLILIPECLFVIIIALTGSKKGILDLVIGLVLTFLLFGDISRKRRKWFKWVLRLIFGIAIIYMA